jgi:hypothetical protein
LFLQLDFEGCASWCNQEKNEFWKCLLLFHSEVVIITFTMQNTERYED